MSLVSGGPPQPRAPWWLPTWSPRTVEALLVLWLVIAACGLTLLVAGATLWVTVPLLVAGVVNAAFNLVATVYLRRRREQR